MQANDSLSTGRVMKAVVQLCFDTQEWDLLNEHILILTKRRNQLKTVSTVVYRGLSDRYLCWLITCTFLLFECNIGIL